MFKIEVPKGKVYTIIIKCEWVHDFYEIQRIIKSYVYIYSLYLNAYNMLVWLYKMCVQIKNSKFSLSYLLHSMCKINIIG